MSVPAETVPAVLITGASSGIGLACVRKLLERDYRVFAGVRDESSPGELRSIESSNVHVVELDVTCSNSIRKAAERINEVLGPRGLTALVNNAGIALGGPLECLPIEKLRKLLDVNVIGLLAVTQEMLPALRGGKGRIINIGSVSGRIARPFLGPYCASKFALEALTDSLRMELAPSKVPVIMITVGHVRTPLWSKAGNDLHQLRDGLDGDGRKYDLQLAALEAWTERRGGISPERVAAKVAEALTARHPRRRYSVGYSTWRAFGLSAMPAALRDWLLTRKLPKHG